jgi:hypothetical protein
MLKQRLRTHPWIVITRTPLSFLLASECQSA